jgi:uncharacterized protein DUF3455
MKKSLTFNMPVMLLFFIAFISCFTACQKDDTILNPTVQPLEIKPRTSPPAVPPSLVVPAGNEVSYHTFAEGVQIYVCVQTSSGGFAWSFVAPRADLFANSGMNGLVGTHYAGPTWESNSGSAVVGARIAGVTVNPTAIPWLLLGAVSSHGPGIFDGTSYIQRVNTTGGLAPTTGASAETLGQQVEVPYTAEYYFYKPE